jgi:hypothetical protein
MGNKTKKKINNGKTNNIKTNNIKINKINKKVNTNMIILKRIMKMHKDKIISIKDKSIKTETNR